MNNNTSSLDLSITPYQEGVNPPVTKPNPALLEDIGEEGMRELFKRAYLGLFNSPIKHIFPKTQEKILEAGDISADFFIQICGGESYFNQKRGAPRMVGRHAFFTITPSGRVHWLKVFQEALQPLIESKVTSDENIQSFWNYIDIFSMWMINTKEDDKYQ